MSSTSVFLASFSLSLNSVLCTQVLNFSSLFSFLPPTSHPPAYRLPHLFGKNAGKSKSSVLTLDHQKEDAYKVESDRAGYSPSLAAELPRVYVQRSSACSLPVRTAPGKEEE